MRLSDLRNPNLRPVQRDRAEAAVRTIHSLRRQLDALSPSDLAAIGVYLDDLRDDLSRRQWSAFGTIERIDD